MLLEKYYTGVCSVGIVSWFGWEYWLVALVVLVVLVDSIGIW